MEFPLSVLDSILACGIVIIGATLQGSIGFGLGPFSVPLLVLINPIFAPGPLLSAALILTLLIYRREHHAVKRIEVKWAIAGRLVGSILGATFLKFISQDHLSLVFGIAVLFALLIFVGGFHLPITNGNLFGAGTLSGFMGTATSIGGAPMALLYHKKEGPRLRGTLSGVFVIGIIIAITSLVIIGRFGLRELLSALVLYPGVLVGFYLSSHTSKILDRGFIKPTVLIVSGFSAVLLIVRYFN